MNEQIHTPTDAEITSAAESAIKELVAVNSRGGEEATCFLGIQARGGRPSRKTIRKIEMDVALSERMRNTALGPLTNAQRWLDDSLLHPFDQRGTQEGDIRCLVVNQTPAVQQWIDALPHRDTWESFSRQEWQKRKLLGVFNIIVFPDEQEPLIAFSLWSDILLLKRKGWVARMSESRYSVEESESLIYLPPSIDFFFFKNVMFALKWHNFESALAFREVSRQRATELWTAYNQAIPISNSELIWEVIGKNVRNQNTIIKALSHPGRSRPTISRIEAFIRERGLKVRVDNGALALDPRDKAQVDELVLIMADGFVTSDLTSQRLVTLDARPA